MRGFEYSDCRVDDARLVVLNARDAAARGADIRTRTRCTDARHADGLWHLTMQDGGTSEARVLVNAAGPYVSRVLHDVVGETAPQRIRLVKGSHIVVPRLFDTIAATSSRTRTAGCASRSPTSATSR